VAPKPAEDAAAAPAPEPVATPDPSAELWNPNAAVNWSVLFTAAFGARVQALNWRALGEPDKARASMIWFYVTLAMLAGYLTTVMVTHGPVAPGIARAIIFAGLIAWYYRSGRAQARHIEKTYGVVYHHRSWGKPLLIGVGAAMTYYLIGIVVATILIDAGYY
jgi:hypothetical protein